MFGRSEKSNSRSFEAPIETHSLPFWSLAENNCGGRVVVQMWLDIFVLKWLCLWLKFCVRIFMYVFFCYNDLSNMTQIFFFLLEWLWFLGKILRSYIHIYINFLLLFWWHDTKYMSFSFKGIVFTRGSQFICILFWYITN